LVSSLRFLTIVYDWSYTVASILEERLFGAHVTEFLDNCDVFIFLALFSRKVDTYHQLRFWMSLTIFCIEPLVSVSLYPRVTTNPHLPSVSKYLSELIKWKSLVPGYLNFRTSTSERTCPVFDLVHLLSGSRRRYLDSFS
jgi:hypothetical protein